MGLGWTCKEKVGLFCCWMCRWRHESRRTQLNAQKSVSSSELLSAGSQHKDARVRCIWCSEISKSTNQKTIVGCWPGFCSHCQCCKSGVGKWLSWPCLKQHKTWLHIARWVRLMPGGARWRSGGGMLLLMILLFKWRIKKKNPNKKGAGWSCWWHWLTLFGITVRRSAQWRGRAELAPGHSCCVWGAVPRELCFGACTPPWTRSHCWAAAVLLPGCTWCCKHPRIWWEALGSWIGNLQGKQAEERSWHHRAWGSAPETWHCGARPSLPFPGLYPSGWDVAHYNLQHSSTKPS